MRRWAREWHAMARRVQRPLGLGLCSWLVVACGTAPATPTAIRTTTPTVAVPRATATPGPSVPASLGVDMPRAPIPTSPVGPDLGVDLDLTSIWTEQMAWTQVDPGIAGARRFVDPIADSTLVVAYDLVTSDGPPNATFCGPAAGGLDCQRVALPTPWMIDLDARLDWIRAELERAMGRCSEGCSLETRASSMGGDVAGRFDLRRDGRWFRAMYSVRGATPLLLMLDEPATPASDTGPDRLFRTSLALRFSPIDSSTVVNTATFLDLEDRYSIDVPWAWSPRRMTSDASIDPDHWVAFVEPDQRSPTPLEIFVGDRKGRIEVCAISCRSGRARTLDELGALVAIQPDWGFTELTSDLTLDGEPGRTVRVNTAGLSHGPPLRSATFAIHDGRPYVLVFDHWRWPNGPGQKQLASFRFLD